jgi:hypothetical protein
MGRTSLERSNDSGDDVAVATHHRTVGNGLEHFQSTLEAATLCQTIVSVNL